MVGDLCRRVITINLDAAMERPEVRQFKFDPVEMVLVDRGKYVAAILTICRAYFVAGRPNKAPRLASFESWSDTVRSALIWLGKADPVKSMESAKAEDPESTELGNMLEGWAAAIGIGSGSRVKLAGAILKGMNTSRPDGMPELEPTYPEFHAALMAMAFKSTGKRGQQPDAAMLGNYLRRFKGRVIDGKRFMNLPNEKGGSEWWIEHVVITPDAAWKGGSKASTGAVSATSTTDVIGVLRLSFFNLTVCSRRVGIAPSTPLIPPEVGWISRRRESVVV